MKGVTSSTRLEDNVASQLWRLTDGDLKETDSILDSQCAPAAPERSPYGWSGEPTQRRSESTA
jgi:hypothetical protein